MEASAMLPRCRKPPASHLHPHWSRICRCLLLAGALAGPPLAGAQTMQWVAYNDHRPTAPPGANGWHTETKGTTYDFFNTPSYSYALSVFALAEFDAIPAPIVVVNQPRAETIVVELLPFSISVTVQGSSPAFQWHKEGAGPIVGATAGTYSVANASLGDSGHYFVVVTNSYGAVTSTVATVRVQADTSPPKVVRAQPRANPVRLEIVFSEPVLVETAENARNYTIAGTNPVRATLAADGSSAVLILPMPLAFGSTNTLTLRYIIDRAAQRNAMPLTAIPIRAPALTRGFLRADYYLGITWHTVSALTGNAKFPDLYDQTFYRTTSTAQSGFGDNYGLRLWGFFIPPTNGNYTFYVRSDDESEVFLSSDSDPANKRLVASQTGSGRPYDDANGYPRFSTTGGLIAGRLYYFEALLKEGGGQDYLTVVYKAEGEPAPVHNTASVTPIPSSSLACYADAQGISVDLTAQPASTNVLEGQKATFAVAANVAPPELVANILYQWQRSDRGGASASIPGATARRYTTTPLTLADNGAMFTCVVTVPGATTTSSSASVIVSALSPRIVDLAREHGGTHLTFALSTRGGTTYVVEYTDALSPPSWQPLRTVPGTGGDVTVSVTATNSPARFYRIRVEQ